MDALIERGLSAARSGYRVALVQMKYVLQGKCQCAASKSGGTMPSPVRDKLNGIGFDRRPPVLACRGVETVELGRVR